MVSDRLQMIAGHQNDRRIVGVAETGCARRYLCEDPVRIGRGA
jgi:hypothetical protein